MKTYELYEEAVKQLPPNHIDHHESDLYLKACPVSRKLIERCGIGHNPSPFTYMPFKSNLDGTLWYDIPFCYTPFWERGRR